MESVEPGASCCPEKNSHGEGASIWLADYTEIHENLTKNVVAAQEIGSLAAVFFPNVGKFVTEMLTKPLFGMHSGAFCFGCMPPGLADAFCQAFFFCCGRGCRLDFYNFRLCLRPKKT
jgi:hypothetical protein